MIIMVEGKPGWYGITNAKVEKGQQCQWLQKTKKSQERPLDLVIRRLLITCEIISSISFIRVEGREVRFYNIEKDSRW